MATAFGKHQGPEEGAVRLIDDQQGQAELNFLPHPHGRHPGFALARAPE
jgi:hypothetical protein